MTALTSPVCLFSPAPSGSSITSTFLGAALPFSRGSFGRGFLRMGVRGRSTSSKSERLGALRTRLGLVLVAREARVARGARTIAARVNRPMPQVASCYF